MFKNKKITLPETNSKFARENRPKLPQNEIQLPANLIFRDKLVSRMLVDLSVRIQSLAFIGISP